MAWSKKTWTDDQTLLSAANMNHLEEGIQTAIDGVNTLNSALLDKIYPVGSIYMSVNNVSPASFIGGTWTALTNRFLLGASSSYAVNSTGGETSHTLTAAEMPSHNHVFTGSAVTSGNQSANHTHSIPSHTHSIPALSGTAASAGAHTHDFNYYWNSASTSGVNVIDVNSKPVTGKLYTSSNGAHTHSVTTKAATSGSYSGTSGSNSANHTHSVTAKGTIGNTGSSGAHNNMPPYLAVYMWKRTA